MLTYAWANPSRAWDLCSEAISRAPSHPLPRYHRGQGLLLMAKLINMYEYEMLRSRKFTEEDMDRMQDALHTLTERSMDDLTVAEDLLDQWGITPET